MDLELRQLRIDACFAPRLATFLSRQKRGSTIDLTMRYDDVPYETLVCTVTDSEGSVREHKIPERRR